MSLQHNQLAFQITTELLSQLRAGKATSWLGSAARLTTQTSYWQGFAQWPQPDGMFEDITTKATLAVEFKPPSHQKAEYVRGLGQTLTYLRSFDYAAIVLPKLSVDNFEIAQYMADTLNESFASTLPISVFSYEKGASDLSVLNPLQERTTGAPSHPIGSQRDVFWAYWRDLSNHDLLDIIVRMDGHQENYEQSFQWFWDEKWTQGKAQTWEGKNRAAAPDSSFNAQKASTRSSLRHIGLVDQSLRLSEEGYVLSRIGRVYGAQSVAFLQRLSRQILLVGRHLELIFWAEENQRLLSDSDKATSNTFYDNLDSLLEKQGVIQVAPTGAKPHFIRDEPKLWNKLGLLQTASNNRYFVAEQGLQFNWRAIISALGE